MEKTATRQPITPATREAALTRFAAILDNLSEEEALTLNIVWETKVVPTIQWAATPLPLLTFEVTEEDDDSLPHGWKSTNSWRDDQTGQRKFIYGTVHADDEHYITGPEFKRRARATHHQSGTNKDASGLARFLNNHPAEAEKVKDLIFVFMESEAEDESGYLRVKIVCFSRDLWVVRWRCCDAYDWTAECRPVRPA